MVALILGTIVLHNVTLTVALKVMIVPTSYMIIHMRKLGHG